MSIRPAQMMSVALSLAFMARLGATEIVIEADSYMPYTGDSSKDETGFMVDIAKAIWEKKGNTVTYETKTWRQAIDDTRSGFATAVVGASREDAPDLLFPSVEQARAQGTFYGLASASWKYSGPESLQSYRLGIVSDYCYSPEIAGYIKTHRIYKQYVCAIESSPDLLSRFFGMIERKNIDTFLEDRNVVEYFLKSYPNPDQFTVLGSLHNSTPLYIAVSPSAPEAQVLVQELSDGMAELRKSGEVNRIMSRYGLGEITAPIAPPIEASSPEVPVPKDGSPTSKSSEITTTPVSTSSDDVPKGYTAFGIPVK